MNSPSRSGMIEDVPGFVVANIRSLLQKRAPDAFDIPELGRIYFSQYKTYVYPEKYGFTWVTLLQSASFSGFCNVFNSGCSVRLKEGRPTPVVNQQQLRPPEPLPGPSRQNTKPEPMSPSSSDASSYAQGNNKRLRLDAMSESTEDSYVSGTSHVTITKANQLKLNDEKSKIHWIPRAYGLVPVNFSMLLMERIVKPDTPHMYIDCTYCDRNALERLMETKGDIKRVSAEKFANVRNRYNEFEFEKGAIFHHGAAIKMANIDALMDYGLSNPMDASGNSLIGPNELLYFADIYGGPGGTAEYFLWKKKWHAKGFGISPRGKLDYNLLQAEHYPRESFEPYYGEDGVEGTGDISNPYNLARYARFVKDNTNMLGVHFCVASGGDRNDYVDEDQKELRCKYLFMAEFLCALNVVRLGGHYVCRIYDSYTPFTVGLIYLMYRCFDEVAIFKPESSLPASSERYVICKWRKPDFHIREIMMYLSDCHKVDWLTQRSRRNSRSSNEPADIAHLVSRDRMKDCRVFCEYIYRTNTDLGHRQHSETKYLLMKMEYGQEEGYVNQRLQQIQIKCNEQWKIPKECRQKPKYAKASTPDLRAMKLVIPYSFDFYRDAEVKGEMELTATGMSDEITKAKEWYFVCVGRKRGFYLSLGGKQNFRFGGAKWNQLSEKIELMNNTLVYADLVDEIEMNGAHQSITTGFHIIDALVLGGNDVRALDANERYDLICKYALSMNKESRQDMAKIRAKPRYELQHFLKHMEKVEVSENVRLVDDDDEEDIPKFMAPVQLYKANGISFCPTGLVFLKSVKELSAPADALFVLMSRFFWRWTSEDQIRMEDANVNPHPEEDDEEKEDVITTTIISKHIGKI